ncbi:MAG: sulfite exporter TauE/SafE family protein [Phycisphaerae bacterium]
MAESLLFYVLIVVFVATLVRSALGFGEALILVPLLALRIPITVAAPLAVMVSVVAAGTVVIQDWRRIETSSVSVWLLATLFGIPLGFLLLTRVDAHIVKVILGTVIIAFSVFSIRGGSRRSFKKDHWGWLLGCGFAAGVLGGAYGMNGPPLAVYGSLRRWSPQQFRATLQGYFLPASLVGLGGYMALGLLDWRVLRYFLFSLPVMLPALLLGRVINTRLSDHRFFFIVYAVLIMTGGTLLMQALAA